MTTQAATQTSSVANPLDSTGLGCGFSVYQDICGNITLLALNYIKILNVSFGSKLSFNLSAMLSHNLIISLSMGLQVTTTA